MCSAGARKQDQLYWTVSSMRGLDSGPEVQRGLRLFPGRCRLELKYKEMPNQSDKNCVCFKYV